LIDMDQLLSQLIPTQRIGNDGFNWWVGQVEGTAADEKNNKGGYRFKVRIVGYHPKSKDILDTKDLPWANVMMPVNVPFMPGNVGGAHPQLVKGCWVVGFYLDNNKQKPIIMGSIGQTPGATTISQSERPGDDESFKTYNNCTARPVNPATDGKPAEESDGGEGESNKTTGALDDGTSNADGQRVPPADRKYNGQKDEKWCQTVAEKCDNEDIKTKTTILLGEFLAEVQNNNGNIGTYLISPINGTINDGVGIARKYVNKFQKVITEFVARVKGFVIEKLSNAVKDLINALIYPDDTGNVLTPVTEWFNNILKDLGCQMADLGDRLAKWLTNVLMSYVNQIYRAAACQVDALVNGILSKMNSLMEDILGKVLGPIQDILGAIAGPLNILGGAINFVLNLLGISCSGPENECAKYKAVCTDGEKKKDKNDKDFLDDLLESIDNLFPATGADYTQYVCDEAYKGAPLEVTTVGFTGGVPRDGTRSGTPTTKKQKISYTISDVKVTEGEQAQFVVTRTGYLEVASSVTFKTLKRGEATPNEDYLPAEGILGFAPTEKEKTIIIDTLYSDEREQEEDFYIRLKRNSPSKGSGVRSSFIKAVGKCTITERNVKEPYDPYNPKPVNPFPDIPTVFPPDEIDVPTDPEYPDEVDVPDSVTNIPAYAVTADRTSCPEGEFIIYTITTSNVENGTILYYSLTGNGITADDIIGNNLTGQCVINNNSAEVTVGIEDDGVVEEEEVLRFTLNGTGAATDVLITAPDGEDGDDDDDGEGESPETEFDDFVPPTVNPIKVITDPGGGIIEIPIEDPGDPWEEPPYVWIGGEGIGATATPLLDQNGFITEIRIKSPGYGYKLNIPDNAGVRCIIDSFTVLSPGVGYKETPEMYVDGELGIAEAIINEDGFVIGARTLNRELTFSEFPEIVIVGGGGYGARLLPSLACLDTEALTVVGATKIGTGRYVDCP
tara:strand:- start:3447 stop:6314 length:2868 start_codon:yes stop_codon:yes gene_type:complete